MVLDRARQLRALPFSRLTEVSSEPAEEVTLGARRGAFSVIVETCEDGRLKVIVQGFLKSSWLPGWSAVALDGFYKSPDGSITEMSGSEFHGYD